MTEEHIQRVIQQAIGTELAYGVNSLAREIDWQSKVRDAIRAERNKIIVNDKGCWIWQGSKDKGGYGHIGAGGKVHLTHRVVYALCSGESIEGVEICHDCPGGDNPSCCNPAHLWRGDHDRNMKDAAKKGRIKPRDSRGEKNPCAVLTAKLVVSMRRRAKEITGRGRFSKLAKEFGISSATASRVVNRVIWKHVEDQGQDGGTQ